MTREYRVDKAHALSVAWAVCSGRNETASENAATRLASRAGAQMDQLKHLGEVFGPLAAIGGFAGLLTLGFGVFVSPRAAALCALVCVVALALYVLLSGDRASNTILATVNGPSAPVVVTAPQTPSYPPASPPPLPIVAPAAPPPADPQSFRDCDDGCPELVPIAPGYFAMGSAPSERGRYANEGPRHSVSIGYRFAVGRFDVTFAQWDACVAAGACNSYRPDDQGWGRDNRPVVAVSWQDAQAYVSWLGQKTGKPYRLLSEAEWEYVARAGTTTAYHWSDEIGNGNANCNGCGSRWGGVQTSPVGSFPPNAFGVYDMLGNVWQWVGDCYSETYDGAPADGSVWQSGDCGRHILRGGSWNSEAKYSRAAYRGRNKFDTRFNDFGFRVARTL